ncbi:Pre-mRNA-processing factor 39 [Hordeum vulgare]|nr:Pre-mRNA-processing factor 39 [Hordeum vulgare]
MFVFEHKEQRRHGICDVRASTSPPLIVRDEDEEVQDAYQEAPTAALRESKEEEHRKEEDEEVTYQAQMAESFALCTIGDSTMSPLAPSSPTKIEPAPTALKPQEYVWDGVVREWVSAPPV